MLIGPNIHSKYAFGNAARPGPSFDALHDACFQPPLFTDLPELPHDSDFSTPPSASSSRMIDTPPHHWHVPLAVEGDFSVEARGNSPYLVPTHLSKDTKHHRPWSETAVSDNYWDRQQDRGQISMSLDLAPNELSSEHTIYPPPSSYSSYPSQSHFDTRRKLSIVPQTLMLPSLPSIPAESPPNSSIAPSKSSWPPSHATQVPIKLHQPRPSRRIPIVSLDELASISENFILPPHKTSHPANSPVEALSPLPFDFHHQSFESNRTCGGGLQSKNDIFCPKFSMLRPPDGGEPSQVILCSCGCMETYTFH
jgi:hypothetical protein